ncbi:MAG: hypothetical protein ACI9Y1_000497 [Lentisphaeria bacterium]|jgi:hypothetical protein
MSIFARFQKIFSIICHQWWQWGLAVLATAGLYYLALLVALIAKFQQLPNYVNLYSWFENVQRIIRSTPSWSDIALIVKEEWIVEIGHMNYDFGIGISQWSLYVAPVKMLSVLAYSAIVISYVFVLRNRQATCTFSTRLGSKIASSLGTGLFALTSITMSWVVCCATPTWIVGLAMMGLGVSTSLWMEPIGLWLNILGFILMFSALLVVVGEYSGSRSVVKNEVESIG